MSQPSARPILPGPLTRALRGVGSHAELHQGMDAFVEELVTRRGEPRALLLFGALLRRNLQEHMRFEEEWVLPWWSEHERAPAVNATVACFVEDHRQLRERLLALLEEAIQAAVRSSGPWRVRELIAGLDDLLDHHDQRETEHLYPRLEEATDPAAARVRERLTTTGLVLVDQARLLWEGWSGGVCDRLLCLYRSWATGAPLPDSETFDFLESGARPRARTLVARDRVLVQRHRARAFPDQRRRLGQERLVEQTLRRTVLVLIDAFLDPCFEPEELRT